MPIRRLPALLVSQIAAGEVIERPASVVKELIENAIDAEATHVGVTIENGGQDLISVTDDGLGIPFAELALAVAPHATGKIESIEDLKAIATLGFRGEALASIASVSRLSVVSRPPGAQEAGCIDVAGGSVGSPRPAAGPPGTSVTVRTLFYNTPVRRRFLRTVATETGHVGQVVEKMALGHPEIGFTLNSNGRQTLGLSAQDDRRRRVGEILGHELEDELLELSIEDRGIGLWGMVGTPDIARPSTRHLYTFLNGRFISDRTVNHAIREAYRGLIDPSRHPTIVLFLKIDPGQVDVNVHPTKAQVRFRNQSLVHGVVLDALRACLGGADLTPVLGLKRVSPPRASDPPPADFGRGAGPSGRVSTAQVVQFFRRLDPTQKGFVYSEFKQALADDAAGLLEVERPREPSGRPAADFEILPAIRPVTDVLQVHSSYLVTQDEQGLLIIDQHALHERVMFERLKEAIARGNLESQRLLMPVMIRVDPSHVELLETLKPLLGRIGIEAEPIGPAAVSIGSFSSFLFERNVEPGKFLSDLLARAEGGDLPDDIEAALQETLDMMACKAAVKAGDRLSPTEIAELLKYRGAVERSSRCPHGRPTTLRLTIRDLEKHFGRR